MLEECNVKVSNTCIIDNRNIKDINNGILLNADIIYLMGGDPILQNEFVINNNLLNFIKKSNSFIIGVSAGSMNLAKSAFIPKYELNSKAKFIKGFGLCDISIIPHFNTNDLEQVNEAKENSKLFNELYKKFDNDLVQARSSYIVNLNVAEFDEKNRAVIYPISKMQGVGEGISSAEINSTACNLLEFSGIHSYLVIGILDNDFSKVHPFVVYRSRNGNYNLMDSALQISVQNMFPSGFHLEEGFRFKAVVKSKDSNGDKRRRVTRYFSYPCELLDVSFKR